MPQPPPRPSARPSPRPTETSDAPAVLIVEDNLQSVNVLVVILRQLYHVSTANNLHEGLRQATTRAFDAVLVDINLGPGGDGIDLLKQLRSMPAYRRTPIIAMTAYGFPGDRERFIDAGFDAFLAKPLTMNHILDVVGGFLGRPGCA